MSVFPVINNERRCPHCGGPKRAASSTCGGRARHRAAMAAFAESQKRLACAKCEACATVIRPGLRWCRACYDKRKATL